MSAIIVVLSVSKHQSTLYVESKVHAVQYMH